jgi:hypothetical protein
MPHCTSTIQNNKKKLRNKVKECSGSGRRVNRECDGSDEYNESTLYIYAWK